MNKRQSWFIWFSGFFAAIALVHAIPFFVRHTVTISGYYLSDFNALVTVSITAAMSAILIAYSAWPKVKK